MEVKGVLISGLQARQGVLFRPPGSLPISGGGSGVQIPISGVGSGVRISISGGGDSHQNPNFGGGVEKEHLGVPAAWSANSGNWTHQMESHHVVCRHFRIASFVSRIIH